MKQIGALREEIVTHRDRWVIPLIRVHHILEQVAQLGDQHIEILSKRHRQLLTVERKRGRGGMTKKKGQRAAICESKAHLWTQRGERER